MDDLVDIPFLVLSHEHGTRADTFLSRRIKRMSRSLAARLIREGQVRRAPDFPLKPSTRVLEGDRIVLKRKKLDEAPTDDIEVPIVYEDDYLVAVAKPGNLVVHPTASAYNRTLIRILRARLGDRELDLAHRIDKETSGLVLLAKDMKTSADLKGQFARREVHKSYLAVVAGAPGEDSFTIDEPMRLVPASETGVLMEIGGEGAQVAVTDVRVLSRGEDASVVEASPKTGRQHQIRLHLRHRGFPIIGDKLYLGGEDIFIHALRGEVSVEDLLGAVGHWRQALHAWRATFRHPATGVSMTLSAPPPPDLCDLAVRFGLDLPRDA